MNEVDLKLSSNEKILGINIDENLVLEWSLSIHIKENNAQFMAFVKKKSFLSVIL